MRFYDEKFRRNRSKYVLQSVLAAIVIAILGVVLDIFLQTTILASIGATAFIVFTMPHTNRAKARYILGGYLVGIVIGYLCHLMVLPSIVYLDSIVMALAVGLSIFTMSLLNVEHPPAVAISMGVVINGLDIMSALIVFFSLFLILIAKRIMLKWMIDLL